LVQEEAVRIRRKLAREDRMLRDMTGEDPWRNRLNLASSLSHLGLSLYKLNRCDESLVQYEEVVFIMRGLVKENSRVHSYHLAGSLNNLGIGLHELRRYADSAVSHQEAVDILQNLPGDDAARRLAESVRRRDKSLQSAPHVTVNAADSGNIDNSPPEPTVLPSPTSSTQSMRFGDPELNRV